eukprot:UN21973
MKKSRKISIKNKHPIKLRFLIWRLQSANPEKKVIPENHGFGSCPLRIWYQIFKSRKFGTKISDLKNLVPNFQINKFGPNFQNQSIQNIQYVILQNIKKPCNHSQLISESEQM